MASGFRQTLLSLRERLADAIYPQPKVGLAVLVFDGEKLLLGKRAKAIGRDHWQASGGHLEFMESFEACALRELAEETGLIGIKPRIVSVTNNPYPHARKHYVTVWVAVEADDVTALQNLEPTKCHGWQWFHIDSLPSPLFEASGILTSDGLKHVLRNSLGPVEQV